ncbi:hypothetical protein Vadar_024157 [Vaccinium darrowii]|uniref:Uncharacterized protein n=1 Tax=Vaccinium darrowii TaxID=229202 RepID=A0ACB7ZMB1_9ERIC|nr:hypothetical protein Vadar_024157 [Vaccinium darrowii]
MWMTLDDTEQLLGLSVIGKAVHTEEEYRDPVTLLKDCLSVSETDAHKALNGGKSVALTYLYKQLGTASRKGVRQLCGYTTLLEAWIHEHFPMLQQLENPSYIEELPRAHRLLPRRQASNVSVSHYRRMLDDLRADQTSWEYHVVPKAKRVRTRAGVLWECHPDYAEWLSRYSHFRVSPDAGAGEVNIDGSATDGLKLAAITQEVDKVFAKGLSPFNMREALRHI